MEISEAHEFLRDHHRAVIATFRREGGLQMCPVLTTVDGEGRAIVSTRETAILTKNLRRDPRAHLCVFTDAFFGDDWVRVDGTAEVVSLPDAMEPLVDYYRRVAGEHDDWDDYRDAMRREQRVLLRISIEEAGPDVAG